jgi:hypothetical protein
MDINPQSAKPISDDQELAKVLAGVAQQTDEPLQFDTPAPVVTPTTPPATDSSKDAAAEASVEAAPESDQPTTEASDEPAAPAADEPVRGYNPPAAEPTPPEPSLPSPTVAKPASSDLTSIKKDALNDLRPLVDKLEIAPEEKFDTYLLLIRSTDDQSLIAPAYAAAQAITDEARKAQALLDVIKEIDYLSKSQ